jgi:NTE family protein
MGADMRMTSSCATAGGIPALLYKIFLGFLSGATVTSPMSWGLVLSGGSAFGIANGGIVEVLEREKLKPDYIGGSSMGAIVGALWALGHSVETLRSLANSLTLFNVAKYDGIQWEKGLGAGVLRQAISEHLLPLLGDTTIGDCRIPFMCVAGRTCKPVNWLSILQSGFTDHLRECVQPYVFPKETKLIDALQASTAIPVLFHPYNIGKDSFIDLAAFGAIPAKELQETFAPDILIATDTNPRWSGLKVILPPGWRQFIDDGIDALQKSKDICNLVITPSLSGNSFRFDQAQVFWEAGKEAAEEAIPKIRTLLEA